MDAWRGEELSEPERKAIAELSREREPRREIEESIVAELRRRGALRPKSRVWWKIGASAAATIALAVVIVGWNVRVRPAAPPQPYWILLLREGDEDRSVAKEESLRRVKEYTSWARSAGTKGLIDGEKLADGGVLLTPDGESPAVRTRESLAGYFLLRETREEDARLLAASCPHLKYGGEIELRRIEFLR